MPQLNIDNIISELKSNFQNLIIEKIGGNNEFIISIKNEIGSLMYFYPSNTDKFFKIESEQEYIDDLIFQINEFYGTE